MRLTFGFSSCPNDTFMFDALVNSKISTDGIDFDFIMEDVEKLNNMSIRNELDISKISYGSFLNCISNYELLKTGSALGENCGPLLIQKNHNKILTKHSKIAVPGRNTTANMLLNLFFPHFENTIEMVFSDIEEAVLNEEVDAGLIIHENRFTYLEKGLQKNADLGVLWESRTNLPIPLGGIVLKRSLPMQIKLKVQSLIRSSVLYAFENPEASMDYIRQNAQEIQEEVIRKHINLYVTNYSVDLGKKGINAVKILLKKPLDSECNFFLGD